MASPQIENGFTPIANELFEKIYQSDFTSRELRIILTVTRYTYGYHRKSARLSIGFLSQATNITYRHTQETVFKLIAKNVLLVNKERKGIQARELQLNKDYDCWKFRCNNNIIRVSTDMPKRDMADLDMAEKGMTEKVSLEMPKPDMSTHAQNGDKEIKKKTLNTISDEYSFSREFIEYEKPNEVNNVGFNLTTSVVDLTIGQNNIIGDVNSAIGQFDDSVNSANGQFDDSRQFRDGQTNDTPSRCIDQNDDSSVVVLANGRIDDKEIKHINKTLNKTSSNVCLIPDELKNLKDFVDVWKDWSDYRDEIKKPLTTTANKVQLNMFENFKCGGYDVFEVINTSISNRWINFYEPRENINSPPRMGNKPGKEYITCRLREITAYKPGGL